MYASKLANFFALKDPLSYSLILLKMPAAGFDRNLWNLGEC